MTGIKWSIGLVENLAIALIIHLINAIECPTESRPMKSHEAALVQAKVQVIFFHYFNDWAINTHDNWSWLTQTHRT